MAGEAGSADKEAAEKYKGELMEFIEEEGYTPDQVFNGDETGLIWKRLPDRTYITVSQKSVPGKKVMKDRFTLLLCANASGDFQVQYIN